MIAGLIHNCVIHPLMPLAERLANTRLSRVSQVIWNWHESTRSVLPGYEEFHSDNHRCNDGRVSNVLHNCIWHPLLPIAEVLRLICLRIWKGHESSLENMPEFENYYDRTHPE